jgi:O-antigen ligase
VDFFLFLLVNATLFIRPAEIVPELAAWPIYNFVIIANLLVAAPAILTYLGQNGLSRCPTTTCVFGVLGFILLSHLARFDTWYFRQGFNDFGKTVAYFLLLVAVVNSRERLFFFLGSIAVFTLALVSLPVLQHHGYIHLQTISVVHERGALNALTGEHSLIPRLQATGIFQDPNDLSMIIVASTLICASALFYKPLGVMRPVFLAPIGFMLYALALTQSRGGLLALFAGCGVLFYSRYGFWRAAAVGTMTLPVALVAFGGRQTGFGDAIAGGTGATRAELWSAGLQAFKSSPWFGIGYGMYSDYAGQVAHNSFVHTFTELGFFGGMMFLGVFAGSGWLLYRLNQVRWEVRDPALRHLVPFMMAILAAFCVSMMSLSRSYLVPTYMVAGLAAITARLAMPGTSVRPLEFNPRWLSRLAVGNVGIISAVYFYIKILHRMG